MPPPPHPTQHDHDHGALLRAAGLRVTPVRLGVLRSLCQAHAALTADQIIDGLARARGGKSPGRGSKPDRVTVYRTLNALVDAGIAHKVDPGDRVFRFGLAGDHAAHVPIAAKSCDCGPSENCAHPAAAAVIPTHDADKAGHPHFLCESCGKVECMDDTEIVLKPRDQRPPLRPAPRIRQQDVLLRGTCGECEPDSRPAPRESAPQKPARKPARPTRAGKTIPIAAFRRPPQPPPRPAA
ncbi:MAG: transcriptional repressor [Phycisphaeraceae bacterium]|nr:transcriptional repressor [Phycisphaeraceae bacterium]